ncbi:hypothetical protein V8D89_001244 [Ganoderma adspersum]
MGSQALPIDVLLLIIAVSPLSAVGTMTRTCHALREVGARFLLDGGVSLIAGRSVVSFVHFMLADALTRFQCLRSLEIVTGALRPREVDALLELISHPSLALDSLILREANLMLKSIPAPQHSSEHADPTPFIKAFSALTTLRHLTIDDCDQSACSLITAIRSPLKTISIGFTPRYSWEALEQDLEWQTPITLLAEVSGTLEEISATNVARSPGDVTCGVVYPSVRKVSVTYCPTLIPRTVAYTSAFPNLTHFSFTAANAHPIGDFHLASFNRHENQALMLNLERHGHPWEHLEELAGGLADVYTLGLTCRVPKLRLIDPILVGMGALQAVLEDSRPTSLAVRFVGAHRFSDGSLVTALVYPCVQDLQTLEMEVCLDVDEDKVDVLDMLDYIGSTLAPISLCDLRLTVNYALFAEADRTGRLLYPAGRGCESLDLGAVARLFCTSIPSLVDAVVCLSTDRSWDDSMCVGQEDDG